jgi:hypothetical protein
LLRPCLLSFWFDGCLKTTIKTKRKQTTQRDPNHSAYRSTNQTIAASEERSGTQPNKNEKQHLITGQSHNKQGGLAV